MRFCELLFFFLTFLCVFVLVCFLDELFCFVFEGTFFGVTEAIFFGVT